MHLYPHRVLEPKGVTEYAVTTESIKILPYPYRRVNRPSLKNIGVAALMLNKKNAKTSSNYASKFNMNALATVVMGSLKGPNLLFCFYWLSLQPIA